MPKKRKPPTRRRRPRPAPQDVAQHTAEIEDKAEADFASGRYAIGLKKLDDIVTDGEPTLRTWLLIGRGLVAVQEYAQALDALERAIRRDPDSLEARFNLGGAMYQLGDVDEAVKHFEIAVEQHHSINAFCNLATIIPGATKATNADVLEARRRFCECLAELEAGRTPWNPPPRSDTDKIRVGYVSAYFHRENYMKPVASLIRAHARDRFEIHLFSDYAGPEDIDWFQAQGGDQIHVTTELDNEELVRLVREQELDVVIDLNAYSVPLRLPIYTYRLAPVVIAWFNMYATSGMPAIDYIVGDPWVIPESEEDFYTERIVRLPLSYLTFDVDYEAPEVVEPPCLTSESFMFGSLISQYKLTNAMWDAWASILQRAPNSRLLLANRATRSSCNRDYVISQFAKRDIESDRIEFGAPGDHVEFLRHYDRIDIALDAFPYNGGTTTTEAIWQGVPVITTAGDRWASRTSRTLLVNGGLEEFVASDADSYVDLAVSFATSENTPQRLAELRRSMRDRLRASPVCDSAGLARSLEEKIIQLVENSRR